MSASLQGRHPSSLWRILIGLVFLVAGAAKVYDPSQFLTSILTYHLVLPVGTEKLSAVIVPWLEVLAGLSLVTGVWADAGLVIVSGLSVLFLGVASQAALRGFSIHCGCFGSLSERLPSFLGSMPVILGRDLVLAFCCVALAWKTVRTAPPP